MNILTMVNRLDMGGVEKTLLGCIPYFNVRGIHSHIITKAGGTLDDKFLHHGCKLHNRRVYNFFLTRHISLIYLVFKYKIDVIHSRDGYTSGFLALIAYCVNTPFVVSVHNPKQMFLYGYRSMLLLGDLRKLILRINKYLTVKFASLIIGHSENNLSYYNKQRNQTPHKFTVIYNGIDFDNFDNSNSKFNNEPPFMLIHIGSFKNSKNHKMLLQILKGLSKRGVKAELLLCGSGETEREIKKLAIELDLKDHVRFLGNVDRVDRVLATADLLIFPSFYEGFGNVLIEAQYMKVPVIASDIPAHREATHHSYHEFLFDVENLGRAIDNCDQLLHASLVRKNNLIENGYQFAKNFSILEMANHLSDQYQRLDAEQ